MKGRLVRGVTAQDHLLGPWEAPVTLLEYGDYQCPHCAQAHQILKQVIARMDGSLRFVFRNFPVPRLHPLAAVAARAAEAAALQGRFWPMHDAIYENQAGLSEEKIERLAIDLGLDEQLFAKDWRESETVLKRVQFDRASGLRSGVKETPAFFIDGDLYGGPWEEGDLTRALSARIRSSEAA